MKKFIFKKTTGIVTASDLFFRGCLKLFLKKHRTQITMIVMICADKIMKNPDNPLNLRSIFYGDSNFIFKRLFRKAQNIFYAAF